jgi:uncharacterized membrane protein YkgB
MTLHTVQTDGRASGNSVSIEDLDVKVRDLLRRLFPAIARAALFVVYTWFGAIKLFGLSPATPLAEALTRHTVGPDYFSISFLALAAYECVIGVLFLVPAATRVVIPLLLLHMAIVSAPLVLVPELTWTAALVPSLEGQYIIKNLAVIALATGIAALRPMSPKPAAA